MKIVAFTGISGSGKTTLIKKISLILQERNYSVTIIKHDPKDKAVFDTPGKDSYEFSSTRADVIVTSPKRTTIFKNENNTDIKSLLKYCDSDFVLIEGLKSLDFPRIGVFRNSIDESYFPYISYAAIKNVDKSEIPSNIQVFDLDNISSIINLITNSSLR